MILTTIDHIPGKQITAHYGLVAANTIRARHLGSDILAGLKNLVGGELKGYTELLNQARREAVERVKVEAEALGANAILNVRMTTSTITQAAAEIYVYGTAVTVE